MLESSAPCTRQRVLLPTPRWSGLEELHISLELHALRIEAPQQNLFGGGQKLVAPIQGRT